MARAPLTFLTLAVNILVVAAMSHDAMPGSETSGLNAMLRAIYGGSKLREFIHKFLEKPLPNMNVGSAVGEVMKLPNGEFEQTFVSAPMSLTNGHVVNKWLPIDWPRGHIAIKAFSAEVAKSDPDGNIPPTVACCGGSGVAERSEVFMHHWTVNKWQLPTEMFKQIVAAGGMDYNLTWSKTGLIEMFAGAGLNAGANGPCWDSNLHLYFGIGNEVRTKTLAGQDAYVFPDPYGVVFDSEQMRRTGEFMILNTHLIDIRGVRNKRACTECKCSELGVRGHINITEGGLQCCHSTVVDGGECPLTTNAETSNVTYFIRYTIKWRAFDPKTTMPLQVITFDATDNNSKWGDLAPIPGGFNETHAALINDSTSMKVNQDFRSGDFLGAKGCHIEWYVPKCAARDSCYLRIINSWEVPFPMKIVFLRNHFHAGGVNMTTYGESGFHCVGKGTYDDAGDLIDISTCTDADGNLMTLRKGQKYYVESFYKQDDLPHYGVMSMSFIYAYIPGTGPEQFLHV